MLTEDKITEIFVMVNEFCNFFDVMHCRVSFPERGWLSFE